MHAQCICGEVKKVFFLYVYCTNFNKNVVSHHMHSKYTAYYGRLGRIPYIYINFKPFSSYCAHKLMHTYTHLHKSYTHYKYRKKLTSKQKMLDFMISTQILMIRYPIFYLKYMSCNY